MVLAIIIELSRLGGCRHVACSERNRRDICPVFVREKVECAKSENGEFLLSTSSSSSAWDTVPARWVVVHGGILLRKQRMIKKSAEKSPI